MNAVTSIRYPIPDIASLKIYRRFRAANSSWIYPVKIDETLLNVRINGNAMWLEKEVADRYPDALWQVIGDIIGIS